MNAPATITADRFMSMALAIRAGDLTVLPPVNHAPKPRYTIAEWQAAADYALDTGDTSEIAHMDATERAFDHFHTLSETQQERWTGFGNFAAAFVPRYEKGEMQ